MDNQKPDRQEYRVPGDFATLSEAIRSVDPWARILLAPGVYAESFQVEQPIEVLRDPAFEPCVSEGVSADIPVERANDVDSEKKTQEETVESVLSAFAKSTLEKTVDGSAERQEEDEASEPISSEWKPDANAVIIETRGVGAIRFSAEQALFRGITFRNCKQEERPSSKFYDSNEDGMEGGGDDADDTLGIEVSSDNSELNDALVNLTPAVVVTEGSAIFEDCVISSQTGCGMVLIGEASPILRRCRFSHSAGALQFSQQSQGTFDKCTFVGLDVRGILLVEQADPTFRDCEIAECRKEGVIIAGGAKGVFLNCVIRDNRLINTVLVDHADPTFGNCRFLNARENGLLIAKEAKGTFEDCEISGNRSFGVTIDERSDPSFSRCRFTDNWKMGVLCDHESSGTFDTCEIRQNRSSNVGVVHESKPVFRNCSMSDGRDEGVYIAECGFGTFENCRFERNHTSNIRVLQEGGPKFVGCTIADGEKLGIHVIEFGRASFESCTVRGSGEESIFVSSEAKVKFQQMRILDGRKGGVIIRDSAKLTCEKTTIQQHVPFSIGVIEKGVLECSDCDLYGRVIVSEPDSTASASFRGCTFTAPDQPNRKQPSLVLDAGSQTELFECRFQKSRVADILVDPKAVMSQVDTMSHRRVLGMLWERDRLPVVEKKRAEGAIHWVTVRNVVLWLLLLLVIVVALVMESNSFKKVPRRGSRMIPCEPSIVSQETVRHV